MDIDGQIEKVQRRATKIVKRRKSMIYVEIFEQIRNGQPGNKITVTN